LMPRHVLETAMAIEMSMEINLLRPMGGGVARRLPLMRRNDSSAEWTVTVPRVSFVTLDYGHRDYDAVLFAYNVTEQPALGANFGKYVAAGKVYPRLPYACKGWVSYLEYDGEGKLICKTAFGPIYKKQLWEKYLPIGARVLHGISTDPGASGAPIMVGDHLVGIHLGWMEATHKGATPNQRKNYLTTWPAIRAAFMFQAYLGKESPQSQSVYSDASEHYSRYQQEDREEVENWGRVQAIMYDWNNGASWGETQEEIYDLPLHIRKQVVRDLNEAGGDPAMFFGLEPEALGQEYEDDDEFETEQERWQREADEQDELDIYRGEAWRDQHGRVHHNHLDSRPGPGIKVPEVTPQGGAAADESDYDPDEPFDEFFEVLPTQVPPVSPAPAVPKREGTPQPQTVAAPPAKAKRKRRRPRKPRKGVEARPPSEQGGPVAGPVDQCEESFGSPKAQAPPRAGLKQRKSGKAPREKATTSSGPAAPRRFVYSMTRVDTRQLAHYEPLASAATHVVPAPSAEPLQASKSKRD
jgi:hypothetical protein